MTVEERRMSQADRAADILDYYDRPTAGMVELVREEYPRFDHLPDETIRVALAVSVALLGVEARSSGDMAVQDCARLRKKTAAVALALRDAIPQLGQIVRHDVLGDLGTACSAFDSGVKVVGR